MKACVVRPTLVSGLTLLTAIWMSTSSVASQPRVTYPTHPISLYCPFTAGSISDIETRVLAESLKNELKQPVSVINVPGASSAIGASGLQQYPADGYSLLMDLSGYLSYVIATHKINYSADDFLPIGSLSNEAIGLVGRANDPRFKSLADIVSYSKSHPNTLSIAGTGAQAIDQKTFNDLVRTTGITATYIPFNGGNQQVAAILGSHVDLGLTAPSNVMNYVESNQMKVFAVASDSDAYAPLPGVMTFKHAGYSFTGNFLRLLFVKKGTNQEIVSRLETALKNVLASRQWKAFETRYVQEHVAMSSQQVQALLNQDVGEWNSTLVSGPKK